MKVKTVTDRNTLVEREAKKDTSKKEGIQKNESGAIYAGELNLPGQDDISTIKARAQKEAMQTIWSQYLSDKEVGDELDDRRAHRNEMQEVMKESNEEVRRLMEKKSALKESFGIEDDSIEQKDLELLEKEAGIRNGSGEKLTKEEQERLTDMGPMTEYQKAAMRFNEIAEHFNSVAKDAREEIIIENYSITAIKLEALKHHGMVDAVKEADEIREAASDEVIGALIQETREQIDEKIEEEKEKAEKAEEEKKEEQERTEQKEKQEKDMEKVNENMSDIQKLDSDMEKAIQEIKNYVQKESVLPADILGIAVDQQV